jgi:hypothetical protein
MTYFEALQLIKENSNLIGTQNRKGFVVSDVIAVPHNAEKRKLFITAFANNGSATESIKPFTSEDMDVWAVDTQFLKEANILFFDQIV